jgi:hypothetical protein
VENPPETPIELAQHGPGFQHSLFVRRQKRYHLALEHLAERI